MDAFILANRTADRYISDKYEGLDRKFRRFDEKYEKELFIDGFNAALVLT